jgi:hypothetical protein
MSFALGGLRTVDEAPQKARWIAGPTALTGTLHCSERTLSSSETLPSLRP